MKVQAKLENVAYQNLLFQPFIQKQLLSGAWHSRTLTTDHALPGSLITSMVFS